MSKRPLRKCPQCRQVKREAITHICQACYAANKQEFDEQAARYQDMAIRPPIRNRNIIAYPLFTYLPEPHEYVLYWWRHLPEERRLLLLVLLASCVIGNSLTFIMYGLSMLWIPAACAADMVGVAAGAMAYLHARPLWDGLATFCKNVWDGLVWCFGGMAHFLCFDPPVRSGSTPLVEPAPDAFPLEYESPYIPPQNPPQGGSVIALPISPYTGQPYDPAWFSETGGGQSNTALLALMKRIKREIEERKNVMDEPQPEYEQVQAVYPESR